MSEGHTQSDRHTHIRVCVCEFMYVYVRVLIYRIYRKIKFATQLIINIFSTAILVQLTKIRVMARSNRQEILANLCQFSRFCYFHIMLKK